MYKIWKYFAKTSLMRATIAGMEQLKYALIYLSIYLSIYLYLSLYIYGIHHCGIFRSSYRKLAWVGFEPTTTELRINALTDIAIRSWVQLAPSANFVQLPQFHLLVQCSGFIWVFAFVGHQICFKRSLAQVIALVAECIYICKLYKRYTYDCI